MQQQTFTFKTPDEGQEQHEPRDAVVKKTPKIHTVSDVVGGAKNLLEKNFSDIWVVGEVSGYKHHSSGHRYFTLKDGTSVLPTAIFKGYAGRIKFDVKDGMEVICHGRVSLYQRGGQYQLIADHIEPKGVGELQLAFEQLKKRLAAEGLFAEARKRPIPYLPKKIGIVTSPTGAAIRDMLKVLKRRFPNVDVLIVPVRVQGEGSAAEIAEGIALLNKQDDIDVMIVGRGGGSIEDLWAFNEEVVARAIYNSKIPVISAVGHEIDFTISDFVADFRAPTPSAAAEHAVPVRDEMFLYIGRSKKQLVQRLQRGVKDRMDRLHELIGHLSSPVKRFPEYYRYIDNIRERMTYTLQVSVKQRNNSFKALVAELNHLSPLAVLSKGYAVVTHSDEKSAIRDSGDLKTGDSVLMRFSKGSAEGKVVKIVD